MRTVWAIFVKEFRAYFLSPVAYVTLTGFTLISGWLFFNGLQRFMRVSRSSAELEKVGGEIHLIQDLLVPSYKNISILLIIMVPAITMRLFAEEKKLKTEELLLTAPIRVSQVVWGKYLASIVLLTVMLLPVGMYPLIIYTYGNPDPGPTVLGYLGLYLYAYALAAIGLFASTLSENQIQAFIYCLVIEMVFLTIGYAAPSLGLIQVANTVINLGSVLLNLSLPEHYTDMAIGFLRLNDIVYFVSLAGMWLFASKHVIESARWG